MQWRDLNWEPTKLYFTPFCVLFVKVKIADEGLQLDVETYNSIIIPLCETISLLLALTTYEML
jgi:hypothetical protein